MVAAVGAVAAVILARAVTHSVSTVAAVNAVAAGILARAVTESPHGARCDGLLAVARRGHVALRHDGERAVQLVRQLHRRPVDGSHVAAVAQQKIRFSHELPPASWFAAQLRQQGYAVPAGDVWDKPLQNVLAAFQMKYRPARFDGQPDAQTAALLAVLSKH